MTVPCPILSRHSPSSTVALACPTTTGLSETKTKQDLLLDAARLGARLPMLSPDQHVLAVFRQDRYAFVVALLAAWSRGYTVCLPPNQRGATITDILTHGTPGARIGALVHDTGAAGYISVPQILNDRDDVSPLSSIEPTDPAVRVMTSGSTGQSVAWNKSASQLLDEVLVLAETFGLTPGTAYVVTVPPTHVYGLLFGVLLPLVSGGAFTRNTPLLPGEIAAAVHDAPARVLVSVPSHLRAARSIPAGALAGLSHVFSSAGPLPEETARSFTSQHRQSITEIFGSTETGGIAWRQRDKDAAWLPLTKVHVSATPDQLLVVASPFTNTQPGSSTFITSDRINLLPDGRFEHLGRQDGVVKIGGQRISIPAMEECLMQHPEVEDVAILALHDEVRGHRLLAAICGPPTLEDATRALLSAQFEPSALPRRFLFLDKLPREANGKLMHARLLRLFGLDDIGSPLSKSLEVSSVTATHAGEVTSVNAVVRVPHNYAGFSGHFDQYPVLAGATQLQQLLLPVLNGIETGWSAPTGLRRIKFTGRIEPGDTVDVALTLSQTECEFVLTKAGKVCSSGILVFDTRGTAHA